MSIRRIKALAKKEFIQIRRDPRSLIATIFIPLLMIFLFGYALSLDVDNIPTLVMDLDNTPQSRAFVSRLGGSKYFTIVKYIHNADEIDDALERRTALMAVVIPSNFSSNLARAKEVPVQVIFDGSDANTTSIAMGYFKGVSTSFNLDWLSSRLKNAGMQLGAQPIEPRVRIWFNPEGKSKNFIIPGLTAVILMVICSLMTALTISREKETGTLEQLISTPIKSGELIAGKLLPYLGVGFVDLWLVVLAGTIIYKVPFRGSYVLLILLGLIFLAGTLGWGLLMSTIARTQLEANQMVILSAFLPSFLLSGFIYPIENMPFVLQMVTYLVPARYFVEILKGLFLKGVGLEVLWPQALFLVVYGTAVLNLARVKFTKRIA